MHYERIGFRSSSFFFRDDKTKWPPLSRRPFFFAISHLILTFDLEMRLLCFTSRENPGNCGYFSNGVAAFIFYLYACLLVVILSGPLCERVRKDCYI